MDAHFDAFDLTRLTCMECSGLRLPAGTASTTSRRGDVRVAGTSPQVRKLLIITNLDRTGPMFGSLEEALTAPTGARAVRPTGGINPAGRIADRRG